MSRFLWNLKLIDYAHNINNSLCGSKFPPFFIIHDDFNWLIRLEQSKPFIQIQSNFQFNRVMFLLILLMEVSLQWLIIVNLNKCAQYSIFRSLSLARFMSETKP